MDDKILAACNQVPYLRQSVKCRKHVVLVRNARPSSVEMFFHDANYTKSVGNVITMLTKYFNGSMLAYLTNMSSPEPEYSFHCHSSLRYAAGVGCV